MKKVKMFFEVVVPYDIMIDDETFKKEYGEDINKLAKYLYEQEGFWWEEELKLIKAEFVKKSLDKL